MAAKNSQDKEPVAGASRDNPEDTKISGAKLQHEDDAIRGGRTDGQILTSEPKASADQSSSPGGEAKPHDPPTRVARPDVPGVVSIATGAGKHVPPSLDEYTPEGRPRGLPSDK
jgi:hypothetical protein